MCKQLKIFRSILHMKIRIEAKNSALDGQELGLKVKVVCYSIQASKQDDVSLRILKSSRKLD